MMTRNRIVKATLRRSDNLTPNERRRAMSAVRGRDTSPERRVATALRLLGLRFQRQGKLVGRPDFLLPDLRVALFVQGCFWHGHGCRSTLPRTNRGYWRRKLAGNRRRDRRVRRLLNRLGWSVITIWECRLGLTGVTALVVRRALERPRRNVRIAALK